MFATGLGGDRAAPGRAVPFEQVGCRWVTRPVGLGAGSFRDRALGVTCDAVA